MGAKNYKTLSDGADNGAAQDLRRQKAADNVGLTHRIFHAFDMLDLTGIFVMNGFDFLKLIFEHLARYIMLPIAGFATLVMSILAWVEYGLSKDKDDKGFLLGRAITETIGAGAVNAAVIGSLVSASFIIGPYLFAGYLGYKALYNFGAAIFFSHKTYKSSYGTKSYEKSKSRMIDTWTGFVVGALATATVITVIIFLQSAFWVMGAVAVGLGAAFTIFKIGQHIYQKKNPPRPSRVVVDHNEPVEDLDDPEFLAKRKLGHVNIQGELLDTSDEEAHAHSATHVTHAADQAAANSSSSSGDDSDLLEQPPAQQAADESSSSDVDDRQYLSRSQVGIITGMEGTTAPVSKLGRYGSSGKLIDEDQAPAQDDKDRVEQGSDRSEVPSEGYAFL